MRILLVEDNISFAKTMEQALGQIADCEVIWVKSRDSALARIDATLARRSDPSSPNVPAWARVNR